MKSKKSPAKKKVSDDSAIIAAQITKKLRRKSKKITASSTAEYFSKNLQQVGFSSATKAVLTTLKESVDNALDACEEQSILPEIRVFISKDGAGAMRGTDKVTIRVEDNGPGLDQDDIPKVFGEYLASSKFGRGRPSRGQQGIGISAVTTWALQTSATGAKVITKKDNQRKAISCLVDIHLKENKGIVRNKEAIDWDRTNGTSVEFTLDGRIQLNGEGGLLTYIQGTILLNPHLTLIYTIQDEKPVVISRVSDFVPKIPEPTAPHPHTMKLGEFIAHARLYRRMKTRIWLRKGFSRITDRVLDTLVKETNITKSDLERGIDSVGQNGFKKLYSAMQRIKIIAPSTSSVLAVGEESLALSIRRLGDVDFFSVLTRKPAISDYKPVQVEIAIARLKAKRASDEDGAVQVLRFANRVPLQFDKSSCAIVKAIQSVNWRSYGLRQPRGGLPVGPYIIAVSVVSPFIKFKNASKETIDASEELVEELRRAMMKCGNRLSRYLKRESRADDLEQRIQHIEQFGPILVETLSNILGAPKKRKVAAEAGLTKILDRDMRATRDALRSADTVLEKFISKSQDRLTDISVDADLENIMDMDDEQPESDEVIEVAEKPSKTKKKVKKASKKKAKKVKKATKKVAKKVKKATKKSKKKAKKATKKAGKKKVKKVVKKAPKKKAKKAKKKTGKAKPK